MDKERIDALVQVLFRVRKAWMEHTESSLRTAAIGGRAHIAAEDEDMDRHARELVRIMRSEANLPRTLKNAGETRKSAMEAKTLTDEKAVLSALQRFVESRGLDDKERTLIVIERAMELLEKDDEAEEAAFGDAA